MRNNNINRFSSKVLSLLLVMNILLPSVKTVYAEDNNQNPKVVTESYANPIYKDLDVDLYNPDVPLSTVKATSTFESLKEASNYMLEEMLKRSGTITFTVNTNYYQGIHSDIYYMATAYRDSSSSSEADYLHAHFAGYNVNMSYTSKSVTFTYKINYLSTYAQEQEVDKKVKEVLDELNVYNASEYKKIKAIHDYIVKNIDYDYTLTNHSAYNAIIEKSSVCQGFTSLTYKMLKELGIGVRYIKGVGNGGAHAWNIVRIGDKWYNIDNTWDENISADNNLSYEYFLKNMADFNDHIRNPEFDTDEFNKNYPMAKESYVYTGTNENPVITANDIILREGDIFNPKEGVIATDKEDGNLTSRIVIKENTVNTELEGIYKIVYEVTDSDNNTITKEIKVTVKSNGKPVITANDITLKEGDIFNPREGVTAIDKEDGDLTSKIVIRVNSVNTNIAGSYKVIYEVSDKDGNSVTKEIKVTVFSNGIPVIDAKDIILKVGDTFNPGDYASARDGEDGDITSNIEIKENTVNTSRVGIYKVIYEVSDKDGNTVTKAIKVTITSNDKPIIVVSDKTLKVGDKFNVRENITASDKEDGDITSLIEIKENSVKTSAPGVYKVVYQVSDSDGNTVTKEVKVTVKNVFINFTVNNISNKSTTITGNGVNGSIVKAYIGAKQIGDTVTVNSSGKYSITIPMQSSKTNIRVEMSKSGYETAKKTITVIGVTSGAKKALTTDIYKYDAGKGKYLTYINGKGYSQFIYLNKSGNYAFTPSSWMSAAGLEVSIPKSTNGYTMTIDNNYIQMYNEANTLLNNIKSGKVSKASIEAELNKIKNIESKEIEVRNDSNMFANNATIKTLTKDIYKYDVGKGKYLTYINGKGYSQFIYLNKSGNYAFTPSSWMSAAGLDVTMPTATNGYTMKITNSYITKYNEVVKQIELYL